jgi:hypothetical protein
MNQKNNPNEQTISGFVRFLFFTHPLKKPTEFSKMNNSHTYSLIRSSNFSEVQSNEKNNNAKAKDVINTNKYDSNNAKYVSRNKIFRL